MGCGWLHMLYDMYLRVTFGCKQFSNFHYPPLHTITAAFGQYEKTADKSA